MQILTFLGLRESLHSECLTNSQVKPMLLSSKHVLGGECLRDR